MVMVKSLWRYNTMILSAATAETDIITAMFSLWKRRRDGIKYHLILLLTSIPQATNPQYTMRKYSTRCITRKTERTKLGVDRFIFHVLCLHLRGYLIGSLRRTRHGENPRIFWMERLSLSKKEILQ